MMNKQYTTPETFIESCALITLYTSPIGKNRSSLTPSLSKEDLSLMCLLHISISEIPLNFYVSGDTAMLDLFYTSIFTKFSSDERLIYFNNIEKIKSRILEVVSNYQSQISSAAKGDFKPLSIKFFDQIRDHKDLDNQINGVRLMSLESCFKASFLHMQAGIDEITSKYEIVTLN